MALMKIDQEGLTPGIAGMARNDGLSDGSIVTLTDLTPGGTTVFELLWVDVADTTSLLSLGPTGDPHIWSFEPTPDVGMGYGFRIRLTHTSNIGVITRQIRIFGIPDDHGFVAPLPGERADPNVTLGNVLDPAVIARCERNWVTDRYPSGNPFGWGVDLMGLIARATANGFDAAQRAAIEAAVTAGGGNPFATRGELLRDLVFRPQAFGWAGGSADIADSLDAAIAAAVLRGCGTIDLPGGVLLCSRRIVVPASGLSGLIEAGITIRGSGGGHTTTVIFFYQNTGGIEFRGNASGGGGLFYGGGLQDVLLLGTSSGSNSHGLVIREAIFSTFENVWVRGFGGRGIEVTDDSVSFDYGVGCQNLNFSNVQVQGNLSGGMLVRGVNQCRMKQILFNQNGQYGLQINGCQATYLDGVMLQGGLGSRSMWLTPRNQPGHPGHGTLGINMHIGGPIYCEINSQSISPITAEPPTDASGNEILITGGVFAVSGGGGPFMDIEGNYNLLIVAKMRAQFYTTGIKARHLAGGTFIGLTPNETLYDFDDESKANSVFLGDGGLHVGGLPVAHEVRFEQPVRLAEHATGSEPSTPGIILDTTINKIRLSTDGALWYSLSVDPFDIAVDLAAYIGEWWDAKDAVTSGANVTSLAGAKHATPMLPSVTPPTKITSAALNGQPAIHFVKASAMYLDTGALAGGAQIGVSGDRPYVLTVFAHHTLGSAAANQPISWMIGELNDRIDLSMDENGASLDTVQARGQDHATGGASIGNSTSIGTTGHIAERYFEGGFLKLRVDGVQTGAQSFAMLYGKLKQVAWGSDVPFGGANSSDVDIALEIFCRAKPPDSVIARMMLALKARFGL